MSNKTPFEIRLEILQMAKDYMDKAQAIQMDFARTAFEKSVEANKATLEEWSKFVPQSYSLEEVTKKAAELYSFVTKKE